MSAGSPVPWYRLNGWIVQGGAIRAGYSWARWQFHILGAVIVSTPWAVQCAESCQCIQEEAT